MPPQLDEIAKIARRLVRRHPDHPAQSLARRLVAESGGAITLNAARCRVRYLLGQTGSERRRAGFPGAKFAPRPSRAPGQGVAMPTSKAPSWQPHDLGVCGLVGILSDIHVPYHHEQALGAAVDYLKKKRIKALLLNGDFADFYSISRWTKKPSERDFKGELRQVRQLLEWLRSSFPRIPIVAKLGNHEERWNHWLWQHAPEISDEPEMGLRAWFKLDDLGIGLVEDQRPIMLGELPVLHGHELPRGISSPVNPARGAWMRTKGTILVGHQHQTSGHSEPDMWHAETFCWSTGCLCDLTPEYARINRWNHGFATVDVHKGGEFDVENLRIVDGKVRSS
jgi:predicted phosphodiesterase